MLNLINTSLEHITSDDITNASNNSAAHCVESLCVAFSVVC